MKIDDLKYLSTTIGNLAGVPIRIYKNKTKIFYYSFVKLPKDPIIPYNERVLDISEHVGYFITPRFHYYGVVNSGEYKIVLGPSRQWTANKTDLTELAFECDVPQDETEEFVNAMENLVALPLDSVLQTLCSVNFVLNKEKLSLADITIYDDEQLRLSEKLDAEQTTKHYDSEVKLSNGEAVHNTLTLEQTIMNFVRHGDVSALKEWIKSAPAVRPGKLSSDTLRQLKNTFIVTATLVSRSAIRGGMDANDALSLSDAYIQKCELLSSVEAIVNLQFHMVLEYTERVERLKLGKNPTKLLTDIANYVQKHLTEPVNIEALSKAVFVSRTHLAVKFKKRNGYDSYRVCIERKNRRRKTTLTIHRQVAFGNRRLSRVFFAKSFLKRFP